MCSNCAIQGTNGPIPVQCGCGTFGDPCGCDNGGRVPAACTIPHLCGDQHHIPYNPRPEGQAQADSGFQPDSAAFQPVDPSSQVPDQTSGFTTPDAGFQATPDPGFQTADSGFQAQDPGFQAPDTGFQAPDTEFQAADPGIPATVSAGDTDPE